MSTNDRKKDPLRLQRENHWYLQTHQLRVGFGKLSVPASLIVLSLIALIMPAVISQFVWYVVWIALALDVFKSVTGVKPSHLKRLLRSNRSFWLAPKMMTYLIRQKLGKDTEPADRPDFVNKMGILHGHAKWKKRSRFGMFAPVFLVASLVTASPSEAQTRLILPKTDVQESSVTDNLADIPMINRSLIINGYGQSSPLKSVLEQIIPKTWDVRFRSAELKNLPVSWRSQNDDLITVMQDIATRYSVLFRYSNRSGVVFVEWPEGNCTTGKDRSNVYTIIC